MNITEVEDYLKSINIPYTGEISNNDSYVIDLSNSNDYGKIYSILDKSEDLDLLDDNQVVTEQGSSLIYESDSTNYMVNLISDWDSNKYQVVINEI